MIKKMAATILTVGVLLSVGMTAGAEERGSVRVWLDPGDLAVTRGEVTLYRVGYDIAEGYQITEEFGGGIVRTADALSPYLAQWLAQTEGKQGLSRLLDADGRAEFSRIADGLYLLVQTESMDGFYTIRPTMLTVPDEGVREVIVKPAMRPIVAAELPATSDHFSPLISAMILILSGLGIAVCVDKIKRKE